MQTSKREEETRRNFTASEKGLASSSVVFLKLITETGCESESEHSEGCARVRRAKGRKDEAPAVIAVASIYRICTPTIPSLPSSAI